MKYINDDMDELFRRAAEGYPLDTRSSDWSRVANALRNPDGTDNTRRSGKTRNLLWILLLMPLPFICNHTDMGFSRAGQHLLNQNDVSSFARASNRNSTAMVTAGNQTALRSELKRNRSAGTASHEQRQTVIQTQNSVPSTYNQHKASGTTAAVSMPIALKRRTAARRSMQPALFERNKKLASSVADDETRLGTANHSSVLFFKGFGTSVQVNAIPPAKNPVETSNVLVSAGSENTVRRNDKGFFAGIVGNIGISGVKEQWAKNPDNSIGIIAGYQLNTRWAFEAGVNIAKKYYLSEGKYFKGGLALPPNAWIKNLDGNCYMYEIPLAVRFNVITKKASSWFITGGLSSYLMKKEAYTYNVAYYNSTNVSSHYYEYNNASQDWFSVLQISIGYTHTLGKIGTLRVEPFAKLPVAGIGIGELPVRSIGLQLGITRKLF